MYSYLVPACTQIIFYPKKKVYSQDIFFSELVLTSPEAEESLCISGKMEKGKDF